MSSKVKFKWTNTKQDYFKEINNIVAPNTLLDYPNFDEEFKIHTDASKFQLWVVIRYNGKPIAFYSSKLTDYQKGYTVIEKELLSIVETLK